MNYLEYAGKIADEIFVEKMQISLSKMQRFLVDKKVASSLKEVKKLPRIEIKGISDNGRERLIMEDLTNSFDINDLECSNGYDTYFPLTLSGVIKCTTQNNGTFYTVFSVISETSETFDLQLCEYVYYNQVFYLRQKFVITDLSKKVPRQPLKYSRETINEFFFKKYKRNELSEFTEEELDYIKNVNCADIDLIACISQALSTFRVVNFINECGSQFGINLQDNDYFTLKHWNNNDTQTTSPTGIQSNTINEQYIEEIIHLDNEIRILNEHSVECVINEIIHRTKSNCLYCAVGFAFKSGLTPLLSAFTKIRESGKIPEIIVGSLQNYDNSISNNRIDKQTVAELMDAIANMTKEEMSDSKFFIKRGYHILSHDNLRKKIDGFFSK